MNKHLPIIAYLGVHNNPNLKENFKQLAECNFNASLWIYYISVNDKNGLKEACQMAAKYGIGIIGEGSELNECPDQLALLMKDQQGFLGYFIKDEPTMEQLKDAQSKINAIKQIDDKHLFYINLFPYYDKLTLDSIHVSTYKEYLNASKLLGWTQISFDYYPITDNGLRENWFSILEEIKQLSDDIDLPWWGFVLSTAHANYPNATAGSMKLQAYVNLAYGAQGIQYFTYQTLLPEPSITFHDGPIDIDYKTKTDTWYLVKDLNANLKRLENIFVGGKNYIIQHSKHLFNLHFICKSKLPSGIKQLYSYTKTGLLVSTFENNETTYYMIVNKDYKNSISIKIKVDDNIKLINQISVSSENVPSKITIKAGDCILLVKH